LFLQQVSEPIHLRLFANPAGIEDEEEDKKFSIELYKFTGGAKPGLRRSTVVIVGDKGTYYFTKLFAFLTLGAVHKRRPHKIAKN